MISTDQKTSFISIIIPTRNEAAHIANTVDRAKQHGPNSLEIIVADCGSVDGTQKIASRHGAQVYLSAPGRARQMNAGAAIAKGDVLLFLHADTLLPQGFADSITTTLNQDGVIAGAFSLSIDLPGRSARLVSMMTNCRSRFLQMPYGDQALFVPRETFQEIGGYPEEPFLEDVLLIKRLKKMGRIDIARSSVLTSGRRWSELGIVRTTLINQLIVLGHLAGLSPQRLQGWYRIGKKI